MVRPLREDYTGAWHHVMNRGRNRDLIFLDEHDAGTFLVMVERVVERFNIEVHAYALMPNHFHLLLRTPLGNLSDAMRHFGTSYTQMFNRRHGKDGSLFRGRFKSQLVTDEMYLTYLLAYIHLNPVRAGLVRRLDAVDVWTGHRRYMGLEIEPHWLCTQELLRRYGSREKLKENMMNLRRKKDDWPHGMNLEQGWISNLKQPRNSDEDNETDIEVTAPELLAKIAEIAGVEESVLFTAVRGRGGNVARRFAVWALHAATCMTHQDIGSLLKMQPDLVAKTLERCNQNLDQFGDWITKWNIPKEKVICQGLTP